jgi:hypothetical protein
MTFRPSLPEMPPATQYIVVDAMWQLGYQGKKKSCRPRAAPHGMLICQRQSCLPYLNRTTMIITNLIVFDEKLYSNWTTAPLHVSQIIKQTKFTSGKLKQRHPLVPRSAVRVVLVLQKPPLKQMFTLSSTSYPDSPWLSWNRVKQEASMSYLQDYLWKCKILSYIHECKV